MKKIRVLCCLALPLMAGMGSYFLLTCMSSSPAVTDPKIEYPRALDLGNHEQGELAVAPFSITNEGGSELTLDEIRSNCSCTGLELEENGGYSRPTSLRLKPGEKVNCVMRVSVAGVPLGASMVNRVSFRTNDPAEPTGCIEAVVRRVTGGVTMSPESLVFGTVPIGKRIREVINVRDKSLAPRKIKAVVSNDTTRVRVHLLETPKPGDSASPDANGVVIGKFEIDVDTTKPGPVHSTIHIEVTGERRRPDKLDVVGTVVPRFGLNPSVVVLPRASATGLLYTASCFCRSTSGGPFQLRIASVPVGLRAEAVSKTPASSHLVKIVCDPTKVPTSSEPQRIRLVAKDSDVEQVLELQVLLYKGK